MTLVAGLVAVGLGAVYLLPVLSPRALRDFGDYYGDLLLLGLVVLALRHGLRRVVVPEQRNFWHRLTAAFAFWIAGDALYASSPGARIGPPLSVLGDAFYFCFYLLLLLAVERRVHLDPRGSDQIQLRRFLIAGTVVALVSLLCYFVLIPVWLSREDYNSYIPSFLLFVALDILLALRLLVMLRECRSSPWRWVYGPLTAAMVLWVAVDAMDALYYAGVVTLESGTILDALWYAPFFLIVLATRVRNRAAGGLTPVSWLPRSPVGRPVLPGLLLLYAFTLPVLHFSVQALGWGEAGARPAREVLVLLSLLTLCGLALAQEVGIRSRNRELHRRLDGLLVNKRLEAVQRLESLGVLAGGIAHDFNNLLVSVLGNADLVLQEPSLGREAKERVRQIRQAALQAADLTGQMLTYAGRGQASLAARDLNQVVAETVELFGTVISKKAELRCLWAPELPPVAIDAVQIRQLTMNLIMNASEALEDRPGEITVATEALEADRSVLDEMLLGSDVAPSRFVALSVADTGSGMSAQTRQRMFDPFFSTKFAGRGLGLAAVLGIVRSHGGALDVQSAVGVGTTMRVLLPVAAGPVSAAGADEAEDWPGGRLGLALVVDDEASVRRVTSSMLEVLGFEVIAARDGQEAVAAFHAHQGDVAAVLLDLTMPVMDGAEALAEIQRHQPDAPVVVMSGYDEDSTRRQCGGSSPRGFLRKPFRFEDLRESLRSVLDRDVIWN